VERPACRGLTLPGVSLIVDPAGVVGGGTGHGVVGRLEGGSEAGEECAGDDSKGPSGEYVAGPVDAEVDEAEAIVATAVEAMTAAMCLRRGEDHLVTMRSAVAAAAVIAASVEGMEKPPG
jgi:hypothetical protein